MHELNTGNWSLIAKTLNDTSGTGDLGGRIGKQCRERWSHHLHPDLRKDAWTGAYCGLRSSGVKADRAITAGAANLTAKLTRCVPPPKYNGHWCLLRPALVWCQGRRRELTCPHNTHTRSLSQARRRPRSCTRTARAATAGPRSRAASPDAPRTQSRTTGQSCPRSVPAPPPAPRLSPLRPLTPSLSSPPS
jgi:hypothetical protein